MTWSPTSAAALDDAHRRLSRSSAPRSCKVELPDQSAVAAAALIVLAVEAASCHAPWLRTRAARLRRRRCATGWRTASPTARSSISKRCAGAGRRSRRISRRSANVDVVVAPASRAAAPTHRRKPTSAAAPDAEAVDPGDHPLHAAGELSRFAGAGGPGRRRRSGLPIGLQLIGRPFGDETLIALGAAFQDATDHHRRMPRRHEPDRRNPATCTCAFTGERTVHALNGVDITLAAGRGARPARRVRLGQERHLAGAAAHAAAAAQPDLAARSGSTARTCWRSTRRPREIPRRRRLDDLPGADAGARSGLHHRRPDRRDGGAAPWASTWADGAQARARDAGGGAHPVRASGGSRPIRTRCRAACASAP